ncbi:MAG: nucleotidyltransferase domain-containing protein [Desulfitobacteriaceae bacterium]
MIVQSMTDKIISSFSPDKIVVFGSWARRETNEHSDVDFLVIMPYNGSKRDVQVAIRRELKGFGVSKDVIVATEQEIEQKQNHTGYIYETALREGMVVYE